MRLVGGESSGGHLAFEPRVWVLQLTPATAHYPAALRSRTNTASRVRYRGCIPRVFYVRT